MRRRSRFTASSTLPDEHDPPSPTPTIAASTPDRQLVERRLRRGRGLATENPSANLRSVILQAGLGASAVAHIDAATSTSMADVLLMFEDYPEFTSRDLWRRVTARGPFLAGEGWANGDF